MLGTIPQTSPQGPTLPTQQGDTLDLPEFVTLAQDVCDIHDGLMFSIPKGFKCRVVRYATTHGPAAMQSTSTLRVAAWSTTHNKVIEFPIFTEDTVELHLNNAIQAMLDDTSPRVPRPYQEYGIDFFLCTTPGKGRLNSDAPGLGKTLIGSEAAARIMEAAFYRRPITSVLYGTAAVPPAKELAALVPPWPHDPPPPPPAQCKRCHTIHAPAQSVGLDVLAGIPTLSEDGLCRHCILALEPIGYDNPDAIWGTSGIPSAPPASVMNALPAPLLTPEAGHSPTGSPGAPPVADETPERPHAEAPYITFAMVPRHLADQWFRHIRRQHPNAYVNNTVGGSRNERLDYMELPPTHHAMPNAKPYQAPNPETGAMEWQLDRDMTNPYTMAFYIVNYEALRSDEYYFALCKLLGTRRVLCILGDESHRLKSADSIQGKRYNDLANGAPFPVQMPDKTPKSALAIHAEVHAWLIRECAHYNEQGRLPAVPYKWLLTATPVKREADDLFHQLNILDRQMFSSKWRFLSDYCTYSQGSYHTVSNVQLRSWAQRHLHFNPLFPDQQFLANHPLQPNEYCTMDNPNRMGLILGRSYKDVGMYLPELVPVVMPIQMETAARKHYDEMRAFWRVTVQGWPEDETIGLTNFMAVMHALRMLTCCDNKLDTVKQIMDDNPGPYVIFHKYDLTAAKMAQQLGQRSYISSYTVPDSDARGPLANKLMAEGKPVVTTFCLNEGVDLSAAKTLIFFEEDTTPGAMQQAIARVQRHDTTLGTNADGTPQTKDPILCFYANCVDTIDEHVHEVQNNRALSIKDIVTMELAL